MELKEAIEILGAFKLANIIEMITLEEFEDVKTAIDIVLKELDDRIPKGKIIKKIIELEKYIADEEEKTDGCCITVGEDMCARYLKSLLNKE